MFLRYLVKSSQDVIEVVRVYTVVTRVYREIPSSGVIAEVVDGKAINGERR